MQPLRQLPADQAPSALLKWREMTLILVRAEGAWFAKNQGEKTALVADYRTNGGRLMCAWTGQYSTDVFEIEAARLAAAFPP